jgi:hypothetical protein
VSAGPAAQWGLRLLLSRLARPPPVGGRAWRLSVSLTTSSIRACSAKSRWWPGS